MKIFMRKQVKKQVGLTTLVVLGVCGALSGAASAHHVWLNATRYSLDKASPNAPAKTTITFGWGDFFPLHDFLKPEQIKQFFLRNPAGAVQAIQLSPEGFHATAIELPSPGTYIIATELTPRTVTRVMDNGVPKSINSAKDAVSPNVKVLESKQTLQFAKAIINVSPISPLSSVTKPLGKGLELVPLANPVQLKEGDYLPIQVYLNGKLLRPPVARPTLEATYLGFSADGNNAWTGDLDGDGTARLKLQRYGIWQVSAFYAEAAPPEWVNKVDKLEYKASLTFEIR